MLRRNQGHLLPEPTGSRSQYSSSSRRGRSHTYAVVGVIALLLVGVYFFNRGLSSSATTEVHSQESLDFLEFERQLEAKMAPEHFRLMQTPEYRERMKIQEKENERFAKAMKRHKEKKHEGSERIEHVDGEEIS